MKNEFVYYDFVDVIDETIFTQEKANEWHQFIVDSYESIYDAMKSMIDYDSPIQFYLNPALLEETIVDAIIGMRKIVDSKNNSVESPNSFKIASYLTYWWLRHKPISVHYPSDFKLDDTKIVRDSNMNEEEYEDACRSFVWKLKHINEVVAVTMITNFIFDFNKTVCGKKECKNVKGKDNNNFCFSDFDEMRRVILNKLLYYLSYRALASKMLEHILEAYTFHPAWALTGSHWTKGNYVIDKK